MSDVRQLLRGERVRLAAMEEKDAKVIASWYDDPRFWRYYDAIAYPRTEEQCRRWLLSQQEQNNAFLFAIRTQAEDQLIGMVELSGILWPHRSSWIAIGIGEQAEHHRGLGTEALQLLIDFAFQECNLYRLQLNVFSYNKRAIALYERLGFQREGTYRGFIERDGQRYDAYLYGLLRDDRE
ncbi:GNAT family N-acetyltransferase [Mechercharimyces sp. CAU 1602]|uniref:GNAT family N-acetyltransferase n=1 Tax=Mechercharimyces sp. CAU 1602 TaxID=2973933 RepID=UPI0021637C9C|nr:GNAT family protein [Mechercharimyces sp. CAU 1602]MCS1351420.1 GNAT family N-acetyltransferase [Mechercharimyces sp. CAU 1602]